MPISSNWIYLLEATENVVISKISLPLSNHRLLVYLHQTFFQLKSGKFTFSESVINFARPHLMFEKLRLCYRACSNLTTLASRPLSIVQVKFGKSSIIFCSFLLKVALLFLFLFLFLFCFVLFLMEHYQSHDLFGL